ncbi:hypothetical protein [Nonomuraea dietziae]|uniref:hypothetical protein n=1 Tax=Nonomuraea dietziae TaxID=65515 RepID=UPI0033E5A1AD
MAARIKWHKGLDGTITGYFWPSSITWQFRIVPIAKGAAYRLDNPLPNQGYTLDREPYFANPDEAKKRAEELFEPFVTVAAQMVNQNERHRHAGNATEYVFPDTLSMHACDGPCDPRDEVCFYEPEAMTMRLIGNGQWKITRPGGRHATRLQEWVIPADPDQLDDHCLFTEDEAFEMVSLLDENND